MIHNGVTLCRSFGLNFLSLHQFTKLILFAYRIYCILLNHYYRNLWYYGTTWYYDINLFTNKNSTYYWRFKAYNPIYLYISTMSFIGNRYPYSICLHIECQLITQDTWQRFLILFYWIKPCVWDTWTAKPCLLAFRYSLF